MDTRETDDDETEAYNAKDTDAENRSAQWSIFAMRKPNMKAKPEQLHLERLTFFYQLWLAIFAHDFIFTTAINALLYGVIAFKAALNASLPFIKSRSLQCFFNESFEYEQQVHFVAPTIRKKPTLISCLIRPLLLVAFIANVCICSYLSIKLIDHLSYGPALSITFKIMVTAGNFLFYVYDTACFLVLRPCCEVIRSYIEHQHRVLRSIVQRGSIHDIGPQKQARLVERVRLNLCTILHLKRKLNDTWGHAIAVSGSMVLCAFCASIYLNFVEEFRTLENLIAIWYMVLTSLDFLDITILSDAMVDEVRNVRHTLQNVETFSENSDYVNQVRMVPACFRLTLSS
ncbi:hypothetical protein HPB51_020004 [Rhipicephalus microplus]|uniref:Uncharacterized protein n=1 Tax=Rhipicephalus microplus TaxID=6941 RepID=A0A9J6E4A8_RHIMP|nr:hypothetical protein HPB51_020004 [Rhipicephalus microplus]